MVTSQSLTYYVGTLDSVQHCEQFHYQTEYVLNMFSFRNIGFESLKHVVLERAELTFIFQTAVQTKTKFYKLSNNIWFKKEGKCHFMCSVVLS